MVGSVLCHWWQDNAGLLAPLGPPTWRLPAGMEVEAVDLDIPPPRPEETYAPALLNDPPEVATTPTEPPALWTAPESTIPTRRQLRNDEDTVWRRRFGLLLRQTREAAGLTQTEVAARSGSWPTQVSSWEAGRGMDLQSFAKVLRVLRADPFLLLGIEERW